jgi:hypothetical protein
MSFPTTTPSSRTVSLGDYPVKSVRSLSGAETRLRYGNARSQASCELQYKRLTPAECQAFINHYDLVGGTSNTFSVTTAISAGWGVTGVAGSGQWRYDGPPQFSATAGDCDKSDASIKLISVV